MDFLRWLSSLRTPALDSFFSALTHLGGETIFMVLAIAIFWCLSKRCGYFILVTCFFGTVFNQFLKIACRVPRPWVLDGTFPIVEAARADAGGYSFPSGHTQNAVGTFGALYLYNKNRTLRIICAALVVLVPFSRMYLGVHTPLDVGVAFL
ncbi:MAG: phosphatase PAP2 family protein, partial [Oscillospiraceae bacterium]|nr:phosphatase PAP2 family protein [Oscillospiraceae bacterium]